MEQQVESPSALAVLGQRIRAARHERGMSQEQLAAPEFTKSYVSAVERGKTRPSLKALDLMSRRLGIPMSELLAAAPPTERTPNLDVLGNGLNYALIQAAILLKMGQAERA